jgi:hypothetical protein
MVGKILGMFVRAQKLLLKQCGGTRKHIIGAKNINVLIGEN